MNAGTPSAWSARRAPHSSSRAGNNEPCSAAWCWTAAWLTCVLLLVLYSGGLHAQGHRGYDARHYDLRFRFDEAAGTVYGDARIDLAATRPALDSIVLDFGQALDVDSVFAGTEHLRFIHEGGTLRVWLPRSLHAGQRASLRIVYHGAPVKGLYVNRPDESYPAERRQIWTQGQPDDARHWFPCNDTPSDKATTEIRATVDSGLVTLSNGELRARTAHADGTVTWHWSMPQEHSTYLVALVAGTYDVMEQEWHGIPLHSYHYPADDAADVRRTYEVTPHIVDFFSSLTGLDYPWNAYAQIPVANFPFGGMENTTATVMADTRMVVDARTALTYDPEPLIAHELAHSWVGNYVTCENWTHTWLNEGFATYLQQLWTLHAHGRDAFDQQRYDALQRVLQDQRDRGYFPVVTDSGRSQALTYSKGALVLHMLHELIGDEQFRKVLHTWLTRHAFGTADTGDLAAVVRDVCGEDWDWFFEQWVYGAEQPVVRWSTTAYLDETHPKRHHGRVLDLEQRSSSGGPMQPPFILGIPVRVITEEGMYDTLLQLSDVHGRLEVRDAAAFVVDPKGTLGVRLEADASAMDEAGERRNTLRHGTHHMLRTAEWMAGDVRDATSRSRLCAMAERDPWYGVRRAALTALTALHPDTLVARNERDVADSLRALFLRLTTDPSPEVRATAFNGLNPFRDRSLNIVFERGLRDSSWYVEAGSLNCLAGIDSAAARPHILRHLRTDAPADVLRLNALYWVREFSLFEAHARVEDLAGPGHSVRLRSAAWQTLLELGLPTGRAEELLQRQLLEPRPEVRMLGVMYAAALPPAIARRLMERLLHAERDPDVLDLIRRFHGMK